MSEDKLLGYKGKDVKDAGFIYAPYIPASVFNLRDLDLDAEVDNSEIAEEICDVEGGCD